VNKFSVVTKDGYMLGVHGDRIEFGKTFISIIKDINIVFIIEKERVIEIIPNLSDEDIKHLGGKII
jgi:hypothetical protein